MQQLRLFFAMALLYMFRVTIPPIIRSTMLYMAFQVGRYTYVVILSIFECSAFRGTARHNKTVITYNSTRPTTIRLPNIDKITT